MNTEEVIKKYYEYVNVGDWNKWLNLFDDNLIIDEQLAGHLEGIQTLSNAVGALEKGYSKFLMHPEETIVEGNKASVIWHLKAANAAGVPIDAKGANYFLVENGKITYMSNFHDTRPFDPFVSQNLN